MLAFLRQAVRGENVMRLCKTLRHLFMIRIPRLVGNHPDAVGIAGIFAALAVIVLPFLVMRADRKTDLSHAREISENLTSIMAIDLEKDGRFRDAQLKAMVQNAEDPITWTLPEGIRNRLLFGVKPEGSYVDGKFIIDSIGRIIAASKDLDENGADPTVTDQDYFLVHKNNPSVGFFVSHPFLWPVNDPKWSMALTRRINKPDGSFGGIALLRLRLELLQRLFDWVNNDANGGVSIVLTDGTVVARNPYSDEDVGSSIAHLAVFRRMTSNSAGSVIGADTKGVQRLFTYRHVPGLPLIAIAAPTTDNVLAVWRKEMRLTESVAVAFGVVLGTGLWLLAFTLRDKLRAHDELARMAATDPLTKLGNRRALELQLKQEWQRARRERNFVSIQFIDIDHFKLFNDTYGHAAGDEVLAKVAQCIASAARRSSDIAARYGGEEFTVVLPGTGPEGAVQVAESIRQRVQNLNISHQGSQTGVVTVSIGCATGLPADGEDPDKLVAGADEQLYRAKSLGRNQVQSIVLTEITREEGVPSEPDVVPDQTARST
jgi:diguanylate cyclase (GGDEF)-like protein